MTTQDEFSPAFSGAFDPLADPPPDVPPMPVPYGGCPWPMDAACKTEEWDALDQDVQERALALASATLHRLTGYQVGGCPVIVRPCVAGCVTNARPSYLDMMGMYGGAGWFPHIQGGVWINSCGCTTNCSCDSLCEVALPRPVGEVYEVTLNGTIVPDTDYRVDAGGIVWIGSDPCPWPTCQDMAAPLDEDNTFGVEYLNAYPVDGLGAYAVGILALEFARACTGVKCRLPAGVTAITRQGVSMEINAGSFPDGFTGIREVDAFIALYNPTPIRQAPQVWSPDLPSPRVAR